MNRGMDVIDFDEAEIATIHRHIFGIVILYIQAGIGTLAALLLIYFLLPAFVSTPQTNVYQIVAMLSIVLIGLMMLIVFVATVIYRESKLVITTHNITQVLQRGLFSRKTSQLTLANVEDVTAIQSGFFATMFNYGTLKVETAGEQANFVFNFCPYPSICAKQILEAREKFVIGLAHSHDNPNP